ncbi:MAG TPA: AraC family transcriptional regulator [Candidatus Merdivicinus intestinigallinarum]|nr:AraC family transcriptional regulator [Candidatus Merdivicinus intestinigallinarum]
MPAQPNSEEFYFRSAGYAGSRLLFCGWQQCPPGHSYGPYIRSYYLMVYVVSGRGVFQARGKLYHLEKGSTFLLFPGETTYYRADDTEPWFYYWIAFEGDWFESLLLRASITPEQPVHQAAGEADYFQKQYGLLLNACGERMPGVDLKGFSILLDLLHHYSITESRANRIETVSAPVSPHISRAVQIVKNRYSQPDLSVSGLAKELGITREYFSFLFRKQYGFSPVQFLCEYRLFIAATLLTTTGSPISRIAEQVGFSDFNYFSRQFSLRYGQSPSAYRKQAKKRLL